MRLALIMAMSCILASPAWAQPRPCNMDRLGVADASGNYLHLQSGQNYRAYPGDNREALAWEPLDRLQVCALGGAAYQITDLSRGGRNARIRALRLIEDSAPIT